MHLYVSLSALYTLRSVPIVKVIFVIVYYSKKKKKEKDPCFGMGKNTKVMPQKPCYLSFLLGKGGNPYVSKLYIKKLSKSALSALPPARKNILIQTLCGQRTPKLTKISFTFPQILHLSSNRRVCNLTVYFQFTTPAREITHRMKFIHPERHEFQKHHVSSLPEARETPKILPRKTRILETPCFFAT